MASALVFAPLLSEGHDPPLATLRVEFFSSLLEGALGIIVQERADALLVSPWAFFVDRRQQIVNFAARNGLPAIYPGRTFVDAGGLMSYGPNIGEAYRRIATYVDKILTGAKPADLPIERPTKIELVINLKTAQALGLPIPPTLFFQATEVIQ